MKIGPFSQMDIERVQGILASLGVRFDMQIDQTAVESWRERAKDQPLTNHPQMRDLLQSYYFEIDDADAHLIGDHLEMFGFKLSDGTEWELDGPEEYYCPRCRHSATDHGLCPRHRMPLITMSEKIAQQTTHTQDWNAKRLFFLALLLFGAAVYIYIEFLNNPFV